MKMRCGEEERLPRSHCHIIPQASDTRAVQIPRADLAVHRAQERILWVAVRCK
jgi:hypothetical protein